MSNDFHHDLLRLSFHAQQLLEMTKHMLPRPDAAIEFQTN